MKEEVSNPKFWQERYLQNNTKWDIGYPTPILIDYLDNNNSIGKICVLGCGNGHDAIEFSKYGNNVHAVDFAKEPLENLKQEAFSRKLDIKLICKDIFSLNVKYPECFDMVYEYTCFCAIDPKRRVEYFNVVHSILKQGGLLFGIFIPLDKELSDDGPPFGVNIDTILQITENKFNVIENSFSALSIEPRLNREKVVILKKK